MYSYVCTCVSYLRSQPVVESVIVGMTKPEHIERNQNALRLCLTPEMIEELNAITDPLKQAMGTNMDLWQGGENSRVR